ncbi:hypothetical protein P0082_07150 [Candidatus Haliotispira prima]|uniref:Uncharacterized protein n=1 Tax=Candidatus Haliotispira prima TaxID=3034016 RepID=A0ABY8MHD2_9SPIO|nr:hypothetical protein P0082_07150 [Candidatus Haliotispira prima]
MLACAPLPDTGDPPAAEPPAAASLNASMAWVSMREGLVQFDNGTQGVKTIGIIVSKDSTPPGYDGIKGLPGFYTRKTKADGTPRTVYLSMTDKMTGTKLNTNIVFSVDGQATGFVSATVAAPEILHPKTKYYAHFYEITGTTGTVTEKLEFTTEDFPTGYPTSRKTYSSFYDQIAVGSTSPGIEYKSSESYLIPLRMHYLHTAGGPYALNIGNLASRELQETSQFTRPFTSPSLRLGVYYDLYNITTLGPRISVALWDGVMTTPDFRAKLKIDFNFGGDEFYFYDNKKAVLVTE